MDISYLKCQGLPVLEAQYKLHTIALNKILKCLAWNRSMKLTCMVSSEPAYEKPQDVTFLFLEENLIPEEFTTALKDYGDRLAMERLILETAIDEIKQEDKLQEDLLNLFRNNARQ